MKIKLIDFGYTHAPKRAHENDAGADVYATQRVSIPPHTTYSMPLGFGLELPVGLAAYVFPRTSTADHGHVCQLPPVDSTYTGPIHAILSNLTQDVWDIEVDDRIGQLVITPIILADFVAEDTNKRGAGNFGSTGR